MRASRPVRKLNTGVGGEAPRAKLMLRPNPVIPGRCLCLHPPGPGVGAASSRAGTTPACADGAEGVGEGRRDRSSGVVSGV